MHAVWAACLELMSRIAPNSLFVVGVGGEGAVHAVREEADDQAEDELPRRPAYQERDPNPLSQCQANVITWHDWVQTKQGRHGGAQLQLAEVLLALRRFVPTQLTLGEDGQPDEKQLARTLKDLKPVWRGEGGERGELRT